MGGVDNMLFPNDLLLRNVSRTLETCYDNYAAALMARKLGRSRMRALGKPFLLQEYV